MDSIEKTDLKELKNFFANRATEIKDEKGQTLSIIGPHLEKIDNSTLSEIDKQRNKKELTKLGGFLRLFDDTIVIDEAIRESPDFLIQRKSKKIGLELRDIYTHLDAKKTEDIIEKIFREIENELSPDIKGVYEIHFKEKASFTTQEKNIKDEVIRCIKTSEPPVNYVKKIEKKSGNTLHLHTNEASPVSPLNKEIVLQALAKQEENLTTYKASLDVTEFWSLLVLDGLKDASDYALIDKAITEDQFTTGFDKVFIFDFSKSKVIELKTK